MRPYFASSGGTEQDDLPGVRNLHNPANQLWECLLDQVHVHLGFASPTCPPHILVHVTIVPRLTRL
jgi:hypothetical protein